MFATNPLVTDKPHIRVYAGIPLFTREGHAIGTLCAIDERPRNFGQDDIYLPPAPLRAAQPWRLQSGDRM